MIWIKDPKKWESLSLVDQLKELKKHYCTGPCGQSSAVQLTRSATENCLDRAINILSPKVKSEEHKQKYINRIKEVVNPMIYKEIDGYDVIQFTASGFWTAESLRVIADYLDERNKPWDYIINEGICHQCGKAKEMSREITENGDPVFYECHYCDPTN